jgi:beta-lactam-binding protein with PASTA domain
VKFGDEVRLALREPVQPAVVPDLVGHTEDEAKKLVEAAKLVYVEHVLKDGNRPGQVVSQRPPAGEQVNAGAPVTADIVRPTHVTTVLVPDIVGRRETAARADIEAVKLVFDPRITEDGSGPGLVVRQSPTPGTRVPVGTAVAADIERSAVRPPPARTVVPDVLGQLDTVARKAIESARLRFGSRIVRPGTGVGTVLNQRPMAGVTVDVGTTVTVDLTREPAPHLVPVPDLVGESEVDARSAVERVQLIFDLLGGRSASVRSRHVVRQIPPAGRQVPTGTTVVVELAADEMTGPPRMLLPLLIGIGLVGGTAMARLLRRRTPRPRRGPPQVRAVALPPTVTSNRLDESGPAHRVRISSHVDHGRQYMREEDR